MRQQLQQLTSREISERDWSVSGFKKDLNIYEERLPVVEKQPQSCQRIISMNHLHMKHLNIEHKV